MQNLSQVGRILTPMAFASLTERCYHQGQCGGPASTNVCDCVSVRFLYVVVPGLNITFQKTGFRPHGGQTSTGPAEGRRMRASASRASTRRGGGATTGGFAHDLR